MGDVSTSGPGAARPFTAGQLFDPDSPYGRLRGSLKPEAKLRGFFHHLAVTQKAKRGEARSRAFAADTERAGKAVLLPLVVSAADPQRPLDAELWLDLLPFGGRGRMLLSFRLRQPADAPPRGTACRALLLTPGMLERLCGAEATRSSDAARRAVTALLAGGGGGEPFEAARVLAAVPELDGEMEEGGFCKFRPFDLPEQAAHVEELPSRTVVLVVLDGRA